MENRIRELREEFHMTQIRLSIELEVSQETVSAYESGKHYPSVTVLLKLSDLFHASCDYILGLSDIRNLEPLINCTSREYRLLSYWRILNLQQQDLVMAYINGIIDGSKLAAGQNG